MNQPTTNERTTAAWAERHAEHRQRRIADGELVDVSEWASKRAMNPGYPEGVPVCLTRGLWDAIEAIPASQQQWQDVRGRAHDVLFLGLLEMYRGVRRRKADREMPRLRPVTSADVDELGRQQYTGGFHVTMRVRGRRTVLQRLQVRFSTASGITIGFPECFAQEDSADA